MIRWFHGAVPYRDLLPVRAASYVVGFFNTNLGRGAMAAYLCRRLQAPFLELGSTVIFLVLTEYTQLVLWSMLGLVGFRAEVTSSLAIVAAAVAIFWAVFFLYSKLHVTPARAIRWLVAPRLGLKSAPSAPMSSGWPRPAIACMSSQSCGLQFESSPSALGRRPIPSYLSAARLSIQSSPA